MSDYMKKAWHHSTAGMTAELNGMHELAKFHYEQAAFWKNLCKYN